MATTPPASWQPDLYDRSATRERVDTVAFTPMHPRLRNELITQAYGDIAEAMGRVLGTGNASWSSLGLWASNSIGRYLAVPIPIIGSALSRPFAHGNRDVFADIGRAHVAFLETVGEAHLAGQPVRPAWRRCRKMLRGHEVEPPGNAAGDTIALWDRVVDDARPQGRPTNRLLRLGFQAYTRSLRLEGDDRARAILVGNLLLALHEQRRLSIAISVGFRSWVRTLTTLPRPMRTQFEWATRAPSSLNLRFEKRWIEFATRHLVGISVPGDTVKVSRPVPSGEQPVEFERWQLDRATGIHRDMSDTEMLNQIYAALDVDGRPATCWNDHVQRMAYITGLFTQQQRSGTWFDQSGAVVRPKVWGSFERKLAKHAAKVQRAEPELVEHVASPLSDDLLDRFRTEPSHPPLPGAELLTFDAIRDRHQRRSSMMAIEEDCQERLEDLSQEGGLLAPDVCRQAREFYQQWSVLMLMGLLFRALPHDYAAARGVKVLGEISSLGTDSLRRAGETTHFVQDLLEKDIGWHDHRMVPDGDALRSIAGVRCLHSIVSGHLIEDGWDSATYGVPVNQEDVLGTALSFAVPPLEMMQQLGVPIPQEQADAYTCYWLGIGHLLGTPIDAVTTTDDNGDRRPLTFAEGQAVTAAIRRRHHARSIDGVRLTEALMAGVGDGFPRGFGWLSHGMLRTVGDPATTALLLSDTGPGRRRAAMIAWGLRAGLRVPGVRVVTRGMVQGIGRTWLQPFVDAGERRPYRHPARHMTRKRIVTTTDPTIWPFGC